MRWENSGQADVPRFGIRLNRLVNTVQQIIVDGYNVIYADDSLRPVALKDLERSRRLFLQRIERYVRNRRVQITVVFDGRGGLTDSEVIVPGKLQALFSARGVTADDIIVGTLERSGSAKSYIVATSDRAVQKAARSLGSALLGAKAFLERISSSSSPASRVGDGESSEEDTDYWLKKFTDAEDEEP